jgi:hypothetical protein
MVVGHAEEGAAPDSDQITALFRALKGDGDTMEPTEAEDAGGREDEA